MVCLTSQPPPLLCPFLPPSNESCSRPAQIDGSGTLEVREIEIAFSKLKGALKRERYTKPAERVTALREAATAIEAFAPTVAFLEKEEKVLEVLRKGTVNSRLGDLLKEKNIDVNDLRTKWDGDGNGKLDLEEFSKNIRGGLGFVATDAEMANLFKSLDADNSGSLASKELVSTLAKLLQDALHKQTIEANQVKAVAQAFKQAEKAQEKVRALIMA